MSDKDLRRRLSKLEIDRHALDKDARPGGRVVVLWQHVDETREQAEERWRNECPGQVSASDLKVIIVRWSKDSEHGAWPAAGPKPAVETTPVTPRSDPALPSRANEMLQGPRRFGDARP